MIGWTTASIDLPGADLENTAAFWEGVTGYSRSPSSGPHDEPSALLPEDGDPYLDVRRTEDGHSRIHLNLYVDDIAAYAGRALELGATEVGEAGSTCLRSPGGLLFCLMELTESRAPEPHAWPGTTSMVNQVCIDIPASVWSSESRFWSDLTGWAYRDRSHEDFRLLHADSRFPIRVLMQRDARLRQATAHLDVGATSRPIEILRHIDLGAAEIEELDGWSRMIDPSGMPYCITDRDPITRRVH